MKMPKRYISKSEFISEVSSIPFYEKQIHDLMKELKRVNYQLYEKVRSANDYDIAGYDEHKETIRTQKKGFGMTPEQLHDLRENLQKQRDKLKSQIKLFKMRVASANKELSELPEPLQTICRRKFLNKETYSQICKDVGMSQATCFRFVNRELDKRYK